MDTNQGPGRQQYNADEFVVATAHRDLVLSELGHGRPNVQAEAPELGLTLVKLGDVKGAAAHVRQQREAAGLTAPRADGVLAALPLEHLLADLRAMFAHRFDHWTPPMGKNRVMHGVHLFPYPSGGGEGFPEPSTAVRLSPYTSNRRAGHDARVAVLDTPIYTNDQLAGTYIAEPASMLRDSTSARPWWAGHATFVAGLILQRAPAARLEVESVLNVDGASTSIWNVARALVRFADAGVDLMNLSFGCFTLDGQPPLVLERAIRCLNPEVVVVAAAGNYGAVSPTAGVEPKPNTPIWPAAFDDVVAVGATDPNGRPAPFTPKVPWLDFMAPGVGVESTYLEGTVNGRDDDPRERMFTGMAKWSGTSFAAATVSGAIAARTVRGRRTAREALDQLRRAVGGDGGVVPTWRDYPGP